MQSVPRRREPKTKLSRGSSKTASCALPSLRFGPENRGANNTASRIADAPNNAGSGPRGKFRAEFAGPLNPPLGAKMIEPASAPAAFTTTPEVVWNVTLNGTAVPGVTVATSVGTSGVVTLVPAEIPQLVAAGKLPGQSSVTA